MHWRLFNHKLSLILKEFVIRGFAVSVQQAILDTFSSLTSCQLCGLCGTKTSTHKLKSAAAFKSVTVGHC